MVIINPITFQQVYIDEERVSGEVVEMLRDYDAKSRTATAALRERDLVMLKIIAKVEMPFNDWMERVTGFVK